MSQRTILPTGFRKQSSFEISRTSFNNENNSTIINISNNRPTLNSNRTRTPYHEESKYDFIKKESSPLEQIRHDRFHKYTSYTHNPFAIINNNRRNNEENSKNDNISNIYLHGMKTNTKERYNISDDNILKINNMEKHHQYISQNNQRSSRRSNQLSLDFNSKNNNNNNNKFLINEEFNNKTANNLQTKTTRVLRIKNVENTNKRLEETNKRLKSVEPQTRNKNTIFYSSHITHKNETKKDLRQNSYNNHKIYNSNYTRRNKKELDTTTINTQRTNNISTINTNNVPNTQKRYHTITVIKDYKEKDKEKEKPKETNNIKDYHIKRPSEQIKTTYNNNNNNINNNNNNNSITLNDYKKEKNEEVKNDVPQKRVPTLMFDIDNDFGTKKPPIKLSPEIFYLHHPKIRNSIYSSENEFKNSEELIKAYAYNTSDGNIREYNEDTITATKINYNLKEKNDYCYFFAVYDGHGGKGCSNYLKNYLHKNISEFSINGLKTAIEITENNFLEKAINNYNNKVDSSGSCGVILLIKKNKCIIANIGDSRLLIFKNKRLFFSTKDHKPNSYLEKKRIESAGGFVHKTVAAVEIYQNGKLIETPWRVYPGGLSVSRTFGDIESKDELFGGKKGVVVSLPDINEFDLNEDYNFIVIGCDGIFDVLSNYEIIDCIKMVLEINKGKNKKINELCGDFASMIIKSALIKESFDNVSCIVIVFNINDFI